MGEGCIKRTFLHTRVGCYTISATIVKIYEAEWRAKFLSDLTPFLLRGFL